MTMVFQRIKTQGIAQLSYFVGDDDDGTAAVIDPRPNVKVYLDLAREYGVAITHVFETHIHADFMSGSRELVHRLGSAHLCASGEAGAEYGYPPFCKAGTADRRYFIKQLIQQSPRVLRPGGHLLFVQSSMANFALTERELHDAEFYFTPVHETRCLFRHYYFDEPGFIEQSRQIEQGFEEIDSAFVETLRVYLCTKP